MTSPAGRLQAGLAAIFAAESAERLRAIEKGLLALETDPAGPEAPSIIDSLFREAHSLKGAAQVVGLTDMSSLAHSLEGRLNAMRAAGPREGQSLQPLFDTLAALQQGDGAEPGRSGASVEPVGAAQAGTIERRTRRSIVRGERPVIAATATIDVKRPPARGRRATGSIDEGLWTEHPGAPGSGATADVAAASSDAVFAGRRQGGAAGTVRVATDRLDGLLRRATELLAVRDRAAVNGAEIDRLADKISAWGREWRRIEPTLGVAPGGHREPAHQGDLVALAHETLAGLEDLERTAAAARRTSRSDQARLAALADGLGADLLNLRLVAVATLFDQFSRMVRDLARAAGKSIEFREAGWQTEVDRELLERLKDPVMHLLRNAVDHGIESESERRAAGKSPRGTIVLEAGYRGGGVTIEVRDDGRGIDPGSVRQAAIRAGIPEHELPASADLDAILPFLLRSGVSTASGVTTVSGRGVGLDVVREEVSRAGGSIEVSSELGRGTRVSLHLPLTLILVHVLLVRLGSRSLALPIAAVERCLRVETDELTEIGGRPAIRFPDGTVPLADLRDVMGMSRDGREPNETRAVILLRTPGGRVGLLADAVMSERNVVVRGLEPWMTASLGVPLVAGATLVGDDELVLVLDAAGLVAAALGSRSPTVVATRDNLDAVQPLSVLVVDDSITTRTLEKSILEAAGFAVTVAEDGLRGLAALRRTRFDVVVADVDMPNMDGLELTRRLKAEAATRDMPVILVTGMETPEQQQDGLHAGADAYLLKSAFDQRELIQAIRRLVG